VTDEGAPFRHPIDWRNPDFYARDSLDEEMRRVFDICHTCRRCFSLCDSFPRLFDLIDESETGELDSVDSSGFKHVVDACTLCDMCFMTMCPYTPPHEWNIDFPHLMLRSRAADRREGKRHTKASPRLGETDRNGKLARTLAPVMNWGSAVDNRLTRPLIESVAGVHRDAPLPRYERSTLVDRAAKKTPTINRDAPAFGRKAVLYATCFSNFNQPEIGEAARAVLARNGVETAVVYPQCCGMPQLEEGDIERVAENARKTAKALGEWIDRGYDVIALVASCALMLKLEWPLIVTDDPAIERLSKHTADICEYMVGIARDEGLAEGLAPIDGGITLHLPCHERAQNIGRKSADMLALVPETDVTVIERCSGHGGSLGVTKDFHETAIKVGRPVARKAREAKCRYISSECPLAGAHIVNGVRRQATKDGEPTDGAPAAGRAHHPIELLAHAYGLA
jgi:glycerol-3-phosphate dehydrogenase subunit C